MTTNQEGVHAAVRAVTGTSRSYNEDWHALFDDEGIAAGPFNARMLAWINASLSTSYSNVNEAMQAFAVDQGFANWASMNTFDLVSLAEELLGVATNGVAFVADDMTVVVRDVGTPANAFSGDANDKLTYTSPSTKFVRGASSVLATGTTLRADYIGAVPLGIRVEKALNPTLSLRTQEIGTSPWAQLRASLTANAATAPDGTTTAETFVEDTTAANTHLTQQSHTVTNGQPYCFSVYVKQNGRTWIALALGTAAVYFNLSTVARGTVVGAALDSGIEDCGNGWLRCYLSFTATSTTLIGVIYASTADNSVTHTGSGLAAYNLWQGQLEPGRFPTSPVVVSGSASSRAVDNITLATSAFPWASCSVCTINAVTALDVSAGDQVLWQVDDGTENNRLRIVRDTSRNIRFVVTSGGVEQANISPTTVADYTEFTVAVGWATNDFSISVNGGAATTDALGTVPTVTTMRIGSDTTGAAWDGHVSSVLVSA